MVECLSISQMRHCWRESGWIGGWTVKDSKERKRSAKRKKAKVTAKRKNVKVTVKRNAKNKSQPKLMILIEIQDLARIRELCKSWCTQQKLVSSAEFIMSSQNQRLRVKLQSRQNLMNLRETHDRCRDSRSRQKFILSADIHDLGWSAWSLHKCKVLSGNHDFSCNFWSCQKFVLSVQNHAFVRNSWD